MKKIKANNLKVNKDFLEIDLEGIKIVFSTAEMDRSFNRHNELGVVNLESIRDDFKVDSVKYLQQIHSDKAYIYNKYYKNIKDEEGDAIITVEKNVAVGVFTADCVPIIIVNEEKKVVAAVHSGWKGTFNSIVVNTINKMKEEYKINISNTKVYIGPHIRQCCYEVSEELKEKFIKNTRVEEGKLFKGRNLSMEEFILNDLRTSGIKENNIFSLDLCTHCEKSIKLYSYRSTNGIYGRLFSFVYIK
ncbi:peptidoglycan editing factor PgeF [Clostridium gasigenes]|uniref:peptidoglycan editing factor PgeF n=1 Tax=Clostridium gasigenes TaxID=94869 RepID=UPI001C0B6F2F|nr:peptidoglycan editing factor PgeF [Clostridium gasigenes]MBU3135611.1 peptidoglycan editing factor PgeF [Clostridium gasigenes]